MSQVTWDRRVVRARSVANKFRLHKEDINHCFKDAIKSCWEKINIFIKRNCIWCYPGIESSSTSYSNKLKCQIWKIRVTIRSCLFRAREDKFINRILETI